eukprot:Transcript_7847.p4 GENE.Transcript_7847~~Transcript_7847.p4  ORF type:complete len:115 (-),score=22.20 Transcript_7847:173-517(-)
MKPYVLVGKGQGEDGNCQTLVWTICTYMGVATEALQTSDYSGGMIKLIPQPAERKKNVCHVVAGACTGSWVGSSYDSVWCGRCGHWYCPYHAEPSETFKAAGSCHTCYSNTIPS